MKTDMRARATKLMDQINEAIDGEDAEIVIAALAGFLYGRLMKLPTDRRVNRLACVIDVLESLKRDTPDALH